MNLDNTERRLQKDYSYITLVGVFLMLVILKPVLIAPGLIVLSFLAFLEYD